MFLCAYEMASCNQAVKRGSVFLSSVFPGCVALSSTKSPDCQQDSSFRYPQTPLAITAHECDGCKTSTTCPSSEHAP